MNAIKTIRTLALGCLASLIFFSCAEDEISTYTGESDAFFSLKRWPVATNAITYRVTDFPVDDDVLLSGSWYVQKASIDSLLVSLAMDGTDQGYHVMLIPVSASGNLADYDRPLNYALGANSTAVENTHFKVKAMIPANQPIGAVAVSINRETVRDTTLHIDFNLLPNEHFQTNYARIDRSNTDTTKIDLYQFHLRISSFIEKPPRWDLHMFNYFGKYSQKKMFLLLEITGGRIEFFYEEKGNLALTIAWGKMLKNYLIEQKAKGKTVLDEDDSEMTYGTAV